MSFLRLLVTFSIAAALTLVPLSPGAAAGSEDPGPGVVTPVGTWPLSPVPEVVEGFDPPDSPWGAGHRGVDLLGRVGQPVRSALPGRVSFAGRLAGRGVVVVDHGDTRTTYEPVTPDVEVGAGVAAGDPIGRLGLVGSHCFPRACLHWGWLRGSTYLDPLLLVGLGPVRLLPLWRAEPVGRSGPTALAEARQAAGLVPAVSLLAYSTWKPLLEVLRTGGTSDEEHHGRANPAPGPA